LIVERDARWLNQRDEAVCHPADFAVPGNLTGIAYAELPVATQKAVSIMRDVREL
jgi:hypothetical protein